MSDNDSGDDFDAELLALAGGGDDESSSEEEDNVVAPTTAAESRKAAEKSPPRKGVAQKLKSRAKRRPRRDDSEDEESFGGSGSESPVRPRSPSVGDDLDEEAPLYPVEGKFRSEADRADIMAMTEIEREAILAERATEAQRRAQDQQLKRLLQARKRGEEADTRKRKADADLDDGQRKSSRPKTKASDKIEEYKRQRELKGAQRARGEGNRRDRRSPSATRDSDRDADGESEVEWDDGRRASPPPRKDEPPPAMHDFERIRVGRSQFAKYLFDPPFESLIKGCYCRVNVGQDSVGPKYKMGQITTFTRGRPYTMEGANGKKIFTNQHVSVAHGKKEKEYSLAACSDSKFTESEFSEFKATLSDDNVRYPSRRQTNAKLADIHALINHQWTEANIQAKMNKAQSSRKTYMDFHRDKLTRRRDEAQARGDDATVARCAKDLADLDAGGGPAKNGAGAAAKRGDQQSRLAALNKSNRKTNSEEIRRALVAETVAKQKARAAAILKAKEDETAAAAAAANGNGGLKVPDADDLFGDSGLSDLSRAASPANGRSRASTPVNGAGLREKKSFGQFSKRKMDDEVIAAMDFEIDVDV